VFRVGAGVFTAGVFWTAVAVAVGVTGFVAVGCSAGCSVTAVQPLNSNKQVIKGKIRSKTMAIALSGKREFVSQSSQNVIGLFYRRI